MQRQKKKKDETKKKSEKKSKKRKSGKKKESQKKSLKERGKSGSRRRGEGSSRGSTGRQISGNATSCAMKLVWKHYKMNLFRRNHLFSGIVCAAE